MDDYQLQRVKRELTPEEREHKLRAIAETDAEHDPARSRERYERLLSATAEDSFSGELRRAIQNAGIPAFHLPVVLEKAGISWDIIGPFLRGEASLPSDVIDRLMDVLGLHIALTANESRTAD